MTLAFATYAKTTVFRDSDFVDNEIVLGELQFNIYLIELENAGDLVIKLSQPAPSNLTLKFKLISNTGSANVGIMNQFDDLVGLISGTDVMEVIAEGSNWVVSSTSSGSNVIPNGETNMIPRIANDAGTSLKGSTAFLSDSGGLSGISNISTLAINGIENPTITSTSLTTVYLNDLSNYTIGTDTMEFSYLDTSLFYPPPFDNFITDDGTAIYNGGGSYLEINSNPFSKVFAITLPVVLPINGGLNRCQYFVQTNDIFVLPDDGTEVIAEVELATQCFPGNIPVDVAPGMTNTSQDGRPSTFIFSFQDPVSFLAFDFLITNESIYAVHERLADGKPDFGGSLPDYQSFIHLIEVQKRDTSNPLDDFVRLGVGVNRLEKIARYYVDGVEKLKVSNYWLPSDRTYRINDTGGPPLPADVSSAFIAMGHFNALDTSNPVYDQSLPMAFMSASSLDPIMPIVQYIQDSGYVDPKRVTRADGSNVAVGDAPFVGAQDFAFLLPNEVGTTRRLFNNGAVTRLKYISVSHKRTITNV